MLFGKRSYFHNVKLLVDHLATKHERIYWHDYTKRHNDVVRSIYPSLCDKYNIKKIKNILGDKVVSDENAEKRVDSRIKTDTTVNNDSPDIFMYDIKREEITLTVICITILDLLAQIESYKMLAKDISL